MRTIRAVKAELRIIWLGSVEGWAGRGAGQQDINAGSGESIVSWALQGTCIRCHLTLTRLSPPLALLMQCLLHLRGAPGHQTNPLSCHAKTLPSLQCTCASSACCTWPTSTAWSSAPCRSWTACSSQTCPRTSSTSDGCCLVRCSTSICRCRHRRCRSGAVAPLASAAAAAQTPSARHSHLDGSRAAGQVACGA